MVILLCGRTESAVGIDELREALGGGRWPVLPADSLVRIGRDKVFVAGTQRSVGPPSGRPDPEGDVLRRLDAARIRLSPTCDVLAGVAFSHR